MKYKNIKRILREQVNKNLKVLWTFDEEQFEFTMIFENYNNNLRIYTPKQLLERLKEMENGI